ncbi:MAG: AlwI family type II restriction endonuclease, partial [Thermoplasmata archaeon]
MADIKRTKSRGLPEPQKVSNSPSPIGIHRRRRDVMSAKTLHGSNGTKYLSVELTPTELEVKATESLKLGFERRGFVVEHLGKGKRTPGGKPDIILYDDEYHINVEVTKTTKSQADREFNSIKDHLQKAFKDHPNKKCYCLYTSPETFKRNMDSFAMFNREGDLKILPMDLLAFNHFIKYITTHGKRFFDRKDLERLFAFPLKTTTTDSDILEYINESIMKDPSIEKEIGELRERRQAQKNIEIEAIMRRIHNMLRRKYAKNPDEAVKEVSKIIFLKMYEESKELIERDHENRCTVKKLNQFRKNGEKDPINYLFNMVKEEMREKEPSATIFDENEKIELDQKTITTILRLINGHNFVQMGIDIKGKVYEMFLGSTMKNTALGQYFTPDELIKFTIKIADLRMKDRILDPFCGTGRFLTRSMNHLIQKAERSDEFSVDDVEAVKEKQVYGVDLSKSVFKIARMNMYIHGDGKSNIFRSNMITFNHHHKEQYSVVLTNPPFGDINPIADVEDFEKHEKQIMIDFPVLDRIERNGKELLKSRGYKGGSFLLQRALVFLKSGGKLLTVMDDGVLNTGAYTQMRRFIRENYNILAILSLPHTTFKRLAKSSPKASILYLTKKDNPLDVQETPIFFAHAQKIGIDTRGRPCTNDLDEIAKQLKEFLRDIETNTSIHGGIFNKKECDPMDKS